MKNILKKLWDWFKNNWLSTVIIVAVVFLFIYGYQALTSFNANDTLLQKKLQQQEERHIKEIAALNKITNEQIQEQNRIRTEFDDKLRALREEYSTELENIRKNRRRQQTVLQNNPTELGAAISNVFGIPTGR